MSNSLSWVCLFPIGCIVDPKMMSPLLQGQRDKVTCLPVLGRHPSDTFFYFTVVFAYRQYDTFHASVSHFRPSRRLYLFEFFSRLEQVQWHRSSHRFHFHRLGQELEGLLWGRAVQVTRAPFCRLLCMTRNVHGQPASALRLWLVFSPTFKFVDALVLEDHGVTDCWRCFVDIEAHVCGAGTLLVDQAVAECCRGAFIRCRGPRMLRKMGAILSKYPEGLAVTVYSTHESRRIPPLGGWLVTVTNRHRIYAQRKNHAYPCGLAADISLHDNFPWL